MVELKSFTKPAPGVKLVCEAMCLMFGEKEDWDSAKKLLGKMDLLDQLKDFIHDSDRVAEKKWNKLRNVYLSNPDFDKDKVKKVSLAALSIQTWVLALEKYSKIKKEVAPKEAKLKEVGFFVIKLFLIFILKK